MRMMPATKAMPWQYPTCRHATMDTCSMGFQVYLMRHRIGGGALPQAKISADQRPAVHAAPDTGMQCCLRRIVWRPIAWQTLQQAPCSTFAVQQPLLLLHGACMAIL